MSKNKIIALKKPGEFSEDPLTELLRCGAKQLIAGAVEAELQSLLSQYSVFRNEQGHQQVVRNGYLPQREIQTGIGPVKIKVPKIRDMSGQRIKFNSILLPPYLRKTRRVEEVLPWLYLKGISTGDFQQPLSTYSVKYPNAMECLEKDIDEMLAFMIFPPRIDNIFERRT